MGRQNLFETLNARGYIYQATHLEKIREMLDGEPFCFYLGIEPTADSLHIGHFFAMMMFRYLQDAGHKGLLLIGGATALVGDPSGKSDMRKMMAKEEVVSNFEKVSGIAKKFIKTDGDNPAVIVNNHDWINPYGYIDFMRDVGVHFNINKMLAAEAYSNRLAEGGLTFLEMGYMLMQAYDFVYLNREYGCVMQIGGSDQWGNIVAGVELNRKMKFIDEGLKTAEGDIYGLTCPLLMTNDGKKMGKTEQGALWITGDKTTPYDFYQYFYNVRDEDAETLLKLFTRVDLASIEDMCRNDIIKAKKTMAYEITKLVHGQEEADTVIGAVTALFGGGENMENVPSYSVGVSALSAGVSLVEVMAAAKFLPSKSEGRRMITQGAVSVNGKRVDDTDAVIGQGDLKDGYILLKKGKKSYLKITADG